MYVINLVESSEESDENDAPNTTIIDLVSSSEEEEEPTPPSLKRTAPSRLFEDTLLEPMASLFHVDSVTAIQSVPDRPYNWIDFSVTSLVNGRQTNFQLCQTGKEERLDTRQHIIDLTSPKNQDALVLLGWGSTITVSSMFEAEARVGKTHAFLQNTFALFANLLSRLVDTDEHTITLVCTAGLERSLILFNALFMGLHLLANGREGEDVVTRVTRDYTTWTMRQGRFFSDRTWHQIKNVSILAIIEQLPETMRRLMVLEMVNKKPRYELQHLSSLS